MSNQFDIETIIRLHEPMEYAYLEIGEDPDIPRIVQLRTPNKESVEYYGDINLSLSPEKARQLGAALIQIADFLDASNTK